MDVYVTLAIVSLLVGLVALISFAVYASVRKLADPALAIVPAPEDEYITQYESAAEHDHWAEANGFDYLGGYLFHGPVTAFVGAWQHRDQPTFFCVYCHPGREEFDLVTIYSDTLGLTTGSTKDGQLMPRQATSYAQTFSGLDLDTMWVRHTEAQQYLETNARLTRHPWTKPFEATLVDAIHQQTDYVRSLLFWPLRGTYWYFVRRSRWHNRSIESQHQARMIRLPNEVLSP